MTKKIIKIFLIIALLFSFLIINVNADTNNTFKSTYKTNLDIGDVKGTGKRVTSKENLGHTIEDGTKVYEKNDLLNGIKSNKHISAGTTGEKGIRNMILNIAESVRIIFLIVTGVYFLIIVLRLLFTESADEEFEKFKKGIRWITTGIIIMQISYSFVETIYNKEIDGNLAGSLIQNIIQPMVNLLEAAASFFFIAIAIFAFYKIISSNGNDEEAKKGKMSVAYAIVGFLVIQISKYLVNGVYSETLCRVDSMSCTAVKIKETAGIMFDIVNWTNGFVGIVVVIMIIYTGFQIIFSNGEEEKIKTAKKSLLYIVIGIIILTMNYIILTFFLKEKVLAFYNNLI